MSTNQPKKINVNSSTLVDLKAELLRKQQEFRKERAKAGGTTGIPTAQRKNQNEKEKGSIWSKANVGVLERSQRDIAAKKEEDATLEKSRSTLEVKAKLYEKIANSKDKPEDDDGELFLVDFQRKAMNDRLQERLEERATEERKDLEETRKSLNQPIPEAQKPEEEWIDYVDQFGKSRRCLRKDLEDLKGQVKPLKISGESELLSEDMKRELQRQRWEQEEEEMLNGPTGPIHYTNVQFDEIRSHGVAYYKFSKDEEERKSQMDRLQEIREQTLEQREKKDRLKEKRKAIMAARLAKVKQRRLIVTTQDSDSDEKEEPEEPKEVKAVEPIIRDDSWRQSAPVREWDKGKKVEVDWFQNQRAERNTDFAPPSFYNDFAPPSFYNDSSSVKLSASQQPLPTPVSKEEPTLGPGNIELEIDSVLSQIRSSATTASSGSSNHNVADIPLPPEKDSTSGYSGTQGSSTSNTENIQLPPQEVTPVDSYNAGQMGMPSIWNSDQHYNAGAAAYYPQHSAEHETQTIANQTINDWPRDSHDIPPEEQSQSQDQSLSFAEESHAQSTSSKEPKESLTKSVPSSYSSQPVKYVRPGMQLGQQEDGTIVTPAPQKIAYKRVNLYEVPRTLPQPPSSLNKPSYPSQENVIALSEKKAEKNWMKQYGVTPKHGPNSQTSLPKTNNIPFQSPYVQKSENATEPFKSEVSFDPSKPPPTTG